MTVIRLGTALLLAVTSAAMPASAEDAGEDEVGTAAELDSLQALARSSPSEALPLVRDALERLEHDPGADALEIARTIGVLVAVTLRIGPPIPDDVPPAADRAIAIGDSLLGPSHVELARAIYQRALLHRVAGEYEDARRLGERALAMREAELGAGHADVATVLSFCARVENSLGNHEVALDRAERALAIRETLYGTEHSKVASSLGLVALTNLFLGRYPEARQQLTRVVDLQTRLLGPEHRFTLAAMHNLGLALERMRELADAGETFERLLVIRERTLDPYDPTLAKTYGALASVLWRTGDRERALGLLERTLEIREHAYGVDHPDVGATFGDIGTLELELGRPERAEAALEHALRILEATYGPDHRRVASVVNTLGNARYRAGRLDEADVLLRRALAVREATLPPTHPEVLTSLHNVAKLTSERGDLATADSLITYVVAQRERRLGAHHPRLARSLVVAAEVRRARGDLAGAFESAERADGIARRHFEAVAPALTERQATDLAQDLHGGLGAMIDMALDGDATHALAARTWDAVIRSRAIVLDEMAARRRRVVDTDRPEVTELAGALAAARRTLAMLVLEGVGEDEESQDSGRIEAAWEERHRLERALATASRAHASDAGAREVGLNAVLDAMPRGTALVAFVRERGVPEPSSRRRATPLRYVAFVGRTGTHDVVMRAIGDAEEIDAAVATWRRDVSRPPTSAPDDLLAQRRGVSRSVPTADDEAARARSGDALRALVWDPLMPVLDGVERVYVVPDGSIDLVSLAALPEGGRFLVEAPYLIQYLGTERELARPRVHGGEGMLVVGAPAFDTAGGRVDAETDREVSRGASAPCEDAEPLHFPPLDGARREAELVSLLAGNARPVVRLEGADASERAVMREAPGKQALHLATHGFVLDGRCTPTGSGTPLPGGSVRAATTATNALLLSGLALAGANRHDANGGGDDGILTAEEITGIDLSSVECVVLSACDTGAGEILPSEGVFGLRRAFEIAGAGTLVMSLWQVNDAVTVDWMTAFYDARVSSGLDAAEAAREAALAILTEQRIGGHVANPYYWGAFVATGAR